MRLLLLYALFSLSLLLAWRDPGFCINHPARVLVCCYNNTIAISRALSPSLESVPSLFLCGNTKMRLPPRGHLDFDFYLLESLNPGPGVRGLRLRTVNAHSMRDKAPALSDLVASKAIDLLGVTETWLTTKESSADLPIWTPSVTNLEHDGEEGEDWGCLCHQPINLRQSVCQPKQVSRQFRANLRDLVSHTLLSSISIAHLVLPLLSSVSYKIFCPTFLHSLMIWLWWGTSIFVLIPHHPTPDSYSRSPSIRWLSYPHSWSFYRSCDWFFGMQCSLCFGLWFDFEPLFCCC